MIGAFASARKLDLVSGDRSLEQKDEEPARHENERNGTVRQRQAQKDNASADHDHQVNHRLDDLGEGFPFRLRQWRLIKTLQLEQNRSGRHDDDDEPMVIEYNCRMGDPETEVVLHRLKNDLIKLLIATDQQKLHLEEIIIDKKAAATIVAVSEGYPMAYNKGYEIDFGYLENPEDIKHIDSEEGGVMVFHAGTKKEGEHIITNGGRVLAVSSLADSLADAIELSKEILNQIHFEGMHFRRDIGYEFIE